MNAQKKLKQEAVSAQARVLTKNDFDHVQENVVDPRTFSQWVRQLLQNWRQGTVSVKGRSDVSLSGKKPWKQKGTGRARAGTARSPLWRGGGVTFGPQPRTRTLRISKNMKSGVLNNLLWQMINADSLLVCDWELKEEKPKTSLAFSVLCQLGVQSEKVVLLLSPNDINHYVSFLNIPNVQVMYFDQVNAYDLANASKWLILEKDLVAFKEMVNTWN